MKDEEAVGGAPSKGKPRVNDKHTRSEVEVEVEVEGEEEEGEGESSSSSPSMISDKR
jgi:hypothetical protein